MTVTIDPSGRNLTIAGADGQPLRVDPGAADPTLIRLNAGDAQATILPGVGFNVVDWRVPLGSGLLPVLHAEQDVLAGGSGTRSGHPILFPFPNRIAGATFDWAGRRYELPVSHPGDRHAIHGFVAKRPWTVFEQSGDSSVTGEFVLSRDAPEAPWPGDLRLRLHVELAATDLTITATVDNPDDHPVPFGLGYHPYFAPLGAASPDATTLAVAARAYWVLADLIPTGVVSPLDSRNDLTAPVVVGDRNLDDVLTDLAPFEPGSDGLVERASLASQRARLSIRCDEQFRDMVVFTPGNRQSIAIEPYTCPTDAVHLQASGRDVGWRTLDPGRTWTGVVRHRVTSPQWAGR